MTAGIIEDGDLGGRSFWHCRLTDVISDHRLHEYGGLLPPAKAELLPMIEALQTALDLLPQQGPQRLRAAINDCEFQVQQKWRSRSRPVTIAVPASQPPPATYDQAIQPANAMREGPPKQNLADLL